MKTIRSIYGTFWLMLFACLMLAAAWSVMPDPRPAFGKPGRRDDADVTVCFRDAAYDNVRSDFPPLAPYYTSKDKQDDNFKVKAYIDGRKLILGTWDSRTRWMVLDFPAEDVPDGAGCRPEGSEFHASLRVELSYVNFLNMDEGDEDTGTARITFPENFPDNTGDHWVLNFDAVNVTRTAQGWEIETVFTDVSGVVFEGVADLTNISQGKPNNPAAACATVSMPFGITAETLEQ